ncbi:MAG: hypothetical protein CME62_07495 [Halobacteriovoraceae bacterium]|nr:hypothetical protein [Halobacteriovoraceae bacterium]|tara:strand:- start:13181 stop:13885 length:705 start_codon:yes stop_codon:yes gene_type:complete
MKPTFLLIHGGPGFDQSYFYPYMNFLKRYFELHSYNLGSILTKYSLEGLVAELGDHISQFKRNSKKVYLFAHSFSSILTLKLNQDILNKVDKIILSNWVYDHKWISIFYKQFPQYKGLSFNSLKEMTLFYNSVYFENTVDGAKVLERIKYNDKLQKSVAGVYTKELSLDVSLQLNSHKIISISADKDKITPDTYIQIANLKYKLEKIRIDNSSHFPFIDQPKVFEEKLLSTLGK